MTAELVLHRDLPAPPHRLACTWRWDGEDAETLVTVELASSGEGGSPVKSALARRMVSGTRLGWVYRMRPAAPRFIASASSPSS